MYGRGTFHHHGMVRAAGIPHTMQNTGLDEAFKRNLEGVTCYKVMSVCKQTFSNMKGITKEPLLHKGIV